MVKAYGFRYQLRSNYPKPNSMADAEVWVTVEDGEINIDQGDGQAVTLSAAAFDAIVDQVNLLLMERESDA
jgi:hypothetical protein